MKYYQACAKLELLENNYVEALFYQLKALKECNPSNLESLSNGISSENIEPDDDDLHQENNKLFEKQLERHLVDTLIETVEKQKMKMPVSKSLDSFQILDQELHTFDCQGGSEELFEDSKCEDEPVDSGLENHNRESKDSSLTSAENSTSQEEMDNENSSSSYYNKLNSDKLSAENDSRVNKKLMKHQESIVMQHAVNLIDFYLHKVGDDAYVLMQKMLATAINFWIENKYAVKELEKVFEKHIKKIYYSLGLLLYR